MRRKPSQGLITARLASRERILAGMVDRAAAVRYREMVDSGHWSREMAADYRERAVECDRLAAMKLRGRA